MTLGLLALVLALLIGGALAFLLFKPVQPVVSDAARAPDPLLPKKTKARSKAQPIVKPKKAKKPKLDTSDPRLLQYLKGHRDSVLCARFACAQNSHVLSASRDRVLRLWRLSTSSDSPPFAELKVPHEAIAKLAVSADSAVALSEESDELQVYALEANGERPALRLRHAFPSKHRTEVIDIGLSRDGSMIMSCSGGDDTSIHLWSTQSGSLLQSMKTDRIRNLSAVLSQQLVFCASEFGAPCVWSVQASAKSLLHKAMDLKARTGHKVTLLAVARVAPRCVCVYDDGVAKLWDIGVRYEVNEDARPLHEFALGSKSPTAIALDSTARVLVVASVACISFFDVANGKLLDRIEECHSAPISSIDISGDGRRVLSTGDRFIKVWAVPELPT